MGDNIDKSKELLQRLDFLLKRHESSLKEMYALKAELLKLRKQDDESGPEQTVGAIRESSVFSETLTEQIEDKKAVHEKEVQESRAFEQKLQSIEAKKQKSDLERFIGENLISKIGIAITVIGVGIGAKYAIDHQLISPLTRVLLGYLVGAGLFGFSIRLKKEYENFSAVLLSGAMAIFYFITFAGYSFYDLIPRTVAFILMLLFTVFTVNASIRYNRQVIALFGMVGAYAIPFLLSNDRGQISILFTYISIINAGILVLSAKKYWHALYYTAFILTWLIFAGWYGQRYTPEADFGIGIGFLSLFFAMFYATFLAYKYIRQQQFGLDDVFLLLANTFIFYGYGYALIEGHHAFDHLLGGFTLMNALIHLIIAIILIRKKLADENLIAFITGLVLVFITIAIPVQLDGNWVTLLWVFQAALLFWIGRTKVSPVYEKLSYPLMVLSCGSLLHDWLSEMGGYYPTDPDSRVTVFFNVQFLTSMLFAGSFLFINYVNQKVPSTALFLSKDGWKRFMNIGLPLILLLVIFFSFRIEIETFWNQLFLDSGAVFVNGQYEYSYTARNQDLLKYETLSLIGFSMLYFGIALFLNIRKVKNNVFGVFAAVAGILTVFVFLFQGLYELSELRESFLHKISGSAHPANLWIRYPCIVLMGGLLGMIWWQLKQPFMTWNAKVHFEILFHVSMVWILSSEMIHWLDISGVSQTYKLGLSILWGLYSLGLVAFGIWKGKKYLRIGAIVLFTVTLMKLFTYDLSSLDTIEKTIVFVSLGVLLLIISFLYNKYKNDISGEAEKSD